MIKSSKNNKIRICFIVATLANGGTERQLYNLLNVLDRNKIDPIIFCLTKGEYWEKKIKLLDYSVVKTKLLMTCC